MIELREIGRGSAELKEIKNIFLEAFPREERPPFLLLKRRIGTQAVSCLGIYDDERLVGFSYVLRRRDMAYLMFLAMRREERGRGYGREAMRLLTGRYTGSRFFLALEDPAEPGVPNREERIARHRFYADAGLKDLPFRIHEGALTYAAMGMGGEVSAGEYSELMRGFLGPVFGLIVRTYLIPLDGD